MPQPTLNLAYGTIKVMNATYGLNCNASQGGNENRALGSACDGLITCTYWVSTSRIPDPDPNCAKTYQSYYQCRYAPELQLMCEFSVSRNDAAATLKMSCDGHTYLRKPTTTISHSIVPDRRRSIRQLLP
jgi:hypothetical protein